MVVIRLSYCARHTALCGTRDTHLQSSIRLILFLTQYKYKIMGHPGIETPTNHANPLLSDSALGWEAPQSIQQRLAMQSFPAATLYVVATPIGNLADLSARAQWVLSEVDWVAAEDTRITRQLLSVWGIQASLMAAHQHNEAEAAEQIIQRLRTGARVAFVSDAGTPAIADPGARIVKAVSTAGFRVVPIPGASSVMAALMASGATSDEHPEFIFAGFIPAKAVTRKTWLLRWQGSKMPVVMFEGPHRIEATLNALLSLFEADRLVTIARELTKQFEEIITLTLADATLWLQADKYRQQGEYVLILLPQNPGNSEESGDPLTGEHDHLLTTLMSALSLKDAVRIAAELSRLPKDKLYARALVLKNTA